jgi:hypothetical protein
MSDASTGLTAFVGLAGAMIGGLTSFATTWLTQHSLQRQKVRSEARARREAVYIDFLKEASRLFGDALGHEREEIADLVSLFMLVAQMRLVASPAVIEAAEHVLTAVVNAYLGPNRTLHELRQYAHEGGLDPLRLFSEVSRKELDSIVKV